MAKPAIRIATASDAESLARLYVELTGSGQVNVLPGRITQLAQSPDHALLVVEVDGAVQGTAHVVFCLDAMFGEQPYALIENVVVAAAARGLGLGRALMAEAERRCRIRDVSKIMLLSGVARDEAHGFYLKLGYQGDRKRGFIKYRAGLQQATA
jgi:GNAT superfamily N-acetyltransferase